MQGEEATAGTGLTDSERYFAAAVDAAETSPLAEMLPDDADLRRVTIELIAEHWSIASIVQDEIEPEQVEDTIWEAREFIDTRRPAPAPFRTCTPIRARLRLHRPRPRGHRARRIRTARGDPSRSSDDPNLARAGGRFGLLRDLVATTRMLVDAWIWPSSVWERLAAESEERLKRNADGQEP